MSVNAMIRHAKQNAKLYEEMVELGYSDESFPVWWYSPGREGTGAKTVGQGGTTEVKTVGQPRTTSEEGEQIEGTEVKVVGQGGTTEEEGGQGGTTEEGGGQNWREGKTLHLHPRIHLPLGKVDQLYLRLLSCPLLSSPLLSSPRMSNLIPPPPNSPMRRYPC